MNLVARSRLGVNWMNLGYPTSCAYCPGRPLVAWRMKVVKTGQAGGLSVVATVTTVVTVAVATVVVTRSVMPVLMTTTVASVVVWVVTVVVDDTVTVVVVVGAATDVVCAVAPIHEHALEYRTEPEQAVA